MKRSVGLGDKVKNFEARIDEYAREEQVKRDAFKDKSSAEYIKAEQNWKAAVVDVDSSKSTGGFIGFIFSPEKSEGETNLLQTILRKGWNTVWRIYSLTRPWSNRVMQPGAAE